MQKFKFTKFALSTTAFAIALAAGASSAFAGSTMGCVVSSFSSDPYTQPMRISIFCGQDGTPLVINGQGNCLGVNAEQAKVWESIVLAAFLSGKHLNIWWNDPATGSPACGYKAVSSIQIY
ncbi:MAG: hypothetical protein ABW061_04480 [Polyangiaceae bacterium]